MHTDDGGEDDDDYGSDDDDDDDDDERLERHPKEGLSLALALLCAGLSGFSPSLRLSRAADVRPGGRRPLRRPRLRA